MRRQGSNENASIHCSSCGRDVPEVYAFCPDCGAKLEGSRPIASVIPPDKHEPRRSPRLFRVLIAAAIVVCLLLVYSFAVEPNRVVTERITIRIPDLPSQLDGLRIVHMSDIHVVTIGPRERAAVRIANAADPDAVVISGDFAGGVEGKRDELSERACVAMLRRIKARHGVYGALGTWDIKPVVDKLQAGGVDMLLDRSETFEVNGQAVTIAGVRYDTMDLKAALRGSPAGALRIVIAEHVTGRVERDLARMGVSLCLTGARHGGQIRIPLISSLYGPDYRIGLRRIGPRTWLYANRGLGTSKVAARFLCPPEVSVITLRKR